MSHRDATPCIQATKVFHRNPVRLTKPYDIRLASMHIQTEAHVGITSSKKKKIKAYCETHGVKSLYLFGSRARGDDEGTSDLDLLIEFKDGSHISYLDMMIMKSELEGILGSGIDLVEGASVVNPIRRRRILSERTPLYGA